MIKELKILAIIIGAVAVVFVFAYSVHRGASGDPTNGGDPVVQQPADDPYAWPKAPDSLGEKWPQLQRLFYPTKEQAATAARAAIFSEGGTRWRDVARLACQAQRYDIYKNQALGVLDRPMQLVKPTMAIMLKDLPKPSTGATEGFEKVGAGVGTDSLTGEPRYAYGLLWHTSTNHVAGVSLILLLRGTQDGWCLELPYSSRLHTDDLARVEADLRQGFVVSIRPAR